jgi:hypothetical protein
LVSKIEWLSMKMNEIGPVAQGRCAKDGAEMKNRSESAAKAKRL